MRFVTTHVLPWSTHFVLWQGVCVIYQCQGYGAHPKRDSFTLQFARVVIHSGVIWWKVTWIQTVATGKCVDGCLVRGFTACSRLLGFKQCESKQTLFISPSELSDAVCTFTPQSWTFPDITQQRCMWQRKCPTCQLVSTKSVRCQMIPVYS